MASYKKMDKEALEKLLIEEQATYDAFKNKQLNLDLTRGKPATEQLQMISSLGMDEALDKDLYFAEDGSDIRNYGNLFGLPEARAFFGKLLAVSSEQVMVMNNSSLSLMYEFFVRAMLYPLPGADKAWKDQEQIKVLCPAPGYDRHFAIAEGLGAKLIPVTMTKDGPDMDQVEALVKDESVKAMFCVPLYANPDGTIYSEEVCERLAKMKTAVDFRIIWDNAYCMHHLDWDKPNAVPEVLALASKYGNPNRFMVFSSTSKITYAGSGLACLAASKEDFKWTESSLKLQTIGPDKISQRRHLEFFKKNGGIEAVMRKHSAIIKPKFDLVLAILEEALTGTDLATWSNPKGGYFISLDLMPGHAKAVIQMAREAGVSLTPAGSTFPYKNDPNDQNIRLAPTFPSTSDLELAMKVVVNCVKLSALKQMLA